MKKLSCAKVLIKDKTGKKIEKLFEKVKDFCGVDMNECYQDTKAVHVIDFIALDYSIIVSFQAANGSFSESINAYIMGEKALQEYSKDCMNTLRALKCLKQLFKDDIGKWKLVALKAKKFIVKEL